MCTSYFDLLKTVNGLLAHADNVEQRGLENAAMHMRAAAELLEVVASHVIAKDYEVNRNAQ